MSHNYIYSTNFYHFHIHLCLMSQLECLKSLRYGQKRQSTTCATSKSKPLMLLSFMSCISRGEQNKR